MIQIIFMILFLIYALSSENELNIVVFRKGIFSAYKISLFYKVVLK